VLVAWSGHSVESRWVKDEASTAADAGKLVTISLDGAAAPMGFKQFHVLDLAGWRGDEGAPAFADLTRTVNARLTGERPPAPAIVRSSWADKILKPVPLAVIGAAAVALIAGAVIFSGGADAPEAQSAEAAAAEVSRKSVAVLPFADMSAGGDQEYFSDGITEEILNVLARMPDLKVAGRTSSFKFKGVNEDLRVIGEQLGVAHILEGSIRKQGERVRITAQLIKADDGFHLWSETYDRELTDIFAVQDEISRAVAEALSLKLGAAEGKRAPETVSAAAHDLYLRARQLFAERNADAMLKSIDLFEAAIVLDPDYALAHSGRARTYSALLYFEDRLDVASDMAEAEASAARALELDPANAEAYAVMAQINWFFHWDWDAADEAMRRAIALAPNDAEIVNFTGDHYRHRGELAKAEHYERRAVELNPLHSINLSDLAFVKLFQRRLAEALPIAERGAALDPQSSNSLYVIAVSQIHQGRYEEARTALRKLESIIGRSLFALEVRSVLAEKTGDEAMLDKAIADIRAFMAGGGPGNLTLASALVTKGDMIGAAEAIEAAYAVRDPLLILDDRHLLPEHWPDHPAIQAALDKPELNALYDIRRANGVTADMGAL